jgi:hypothetical protein
MNWAKIGFTGFVTLVLGLIGFGIFWMFTAPTTGTVTGRTYRAPWTSAGYSSTVCTSTDKGQMHCTTTYIPPIYHPECYEIDFHNKEANRNGSACVPASQFDNYEPGSRYP